VPNIGANVTLPVRSATYNLDNQIVTQTIGGVARTITSDADGNITSAPAPDGTNTLQTHAWNTRNQLTSAPGGLTYSYDAEGLRTSYTQGGQTTTFVNDPHGPMSRVLCRIRPDGTRTFYIYGPVLLYEIEEGASGGNPANAARYYHYDHLGSTIALSNDAGHPVARAIQRSRAADEDDVRRSSGKVLSASRPTPTASTTCAPVTITATWGASCPKTPSA